MGLITSYFSFKYMAVFLPAVIGLYLIPSRRFRRLVLLLSGYCFFWAVSGKLLVYLLLSTLSIHHIGLWLENINGECERLRSDSPKEQRKEIKSRYVRKQRRVVAFGVILHIGILLFLKYSPFFAANINSLFKIIRLPIAINIPSFAIPIGISFYTLQAVSYIFDVYRKKIPADNNLFRLALYMSFFPQLMEGPICRYTDTAHNLYQAEAVKWENLTFGMQRILFGLMKKIVVADRLNLFIENVFTNYGNFDGFVTAAACVGYTIQLYMDFSGTMDLVIGSGQILGVRLPENFQRPFFSKTISEFWQRWHITLGTWFKDYIFFPLSMSKPLKKLTGRARKRFGNHFGPLAAGSVALFCVWLCNGLWHGAGWHYIFFGMYHFVLILLGSLTEPFVIKAADRLHIKRDSVPYRIVQIIRTTALVCIGELFFRANGLMAGFVMFKKIFTEFSFKTLHDGTLFSLGMDLPDYIVIIFTLLIILIVGIIQERGGRVREIIARRNIVIRFGIFYAAILFIIIFGAYGKGYVPVDPIYAGF